MKGYKLLPEFIKQKQRETYIIIGATMLFTLFISIFMMINGAQSRNREVDIMAVGITVGITVVIMITLILLLVKKQIRVMWGSFTIFIDSNCVYRHQEYPRGLAYSLAASLAMTDLVINKMEIKSITENRRGLIIKTYSMTKVLLIPRLIEGYEEIRSMLMQWQQIR